MSSRWRGLTHEHLRGVLAASTSRSCQLTTPPASPSISALYKSRSNEPVPIRTLRERELFELNVRGILIILAGVGLEVDHASIPPPTRRSPISGADLSTVVDGEVINTAKVVDEFGEALKRIQEQTIEQFFKWFASCTCPTKTDGSISPSGISPVTGFVASRRDSPVSMVADRFPQSFGLIPTLAGHTHSSRTSSGSTLQEQPGSFPPRTRLTSSRSLSVPVKSPFRLSPSSTPRLKFGSRRLDILQSLPSKLQMI